MSKIRTYMDFIKIEHTLFALPFAYAGALLAARGLIDFRLAVLVLTTFTGIRSAAMTFNRIIDREIDAKNPRTARRHIPAGVISLKEAYTIAAASLAVYFISASLINRTTMILSPIPALTVYIYPYLKRYTCLSHYVLGLNLAFAPIGGWIAVTDSLDILGNELIPVIIGMGVMFWVAGFDMIYALQDIEFDRRERLHSVGAHFGPKVAIWLSRINHLVFLTLTGIALMMYGAEFLPFTLPALGLLLFYEQYMIKDSYDNERIQLAFFHINAIISAAFLISVILDALF